MHLYQRQCDEGLKHLISPSCFCFFGVKGQIKCIPTLNVWREAADDAGPPDFTPKLVAATSCKVEAAALSETNEGCLN